MTTPTWRNRITRKAEESPEALTANPRNWRTHPKFQQDALAEILDLVGWVQDIIVNERTGNIVDGHLRVELAKARGEPTVPVNYVDLSEDEERLILATFDPITYLANRDSATLKELLKTIESQGAPTLERLLEQLRGINKSASGTLRERFIIPPFSVLDSRQGYWQKRREAWLALGFDKNLGRSYGITANSSELASMQNPLSTGDIRRSWSAFDPVLCEIAYRWFTQKEGTIIDPFAGGPTAGIVAGWLGYNFTGIDIMEAQCQANISQWDMIRQDITGNGQAKWVTGDSQKVLQQMDYADLIYSCPPYYDLEQYSDEPGDVSKAGSYKSFLEMYTGILEASFARLKDNRFAVLLVGDIRDSHGFYRNFIGDTISICLKLGLQLYNEAIYIQPIGTAAVRAGRQFKLSRKLGKTHQNLLAFFKGDPGEADFGMLAEAAEMRRLWLAHQKLLVFAKGEPPELGETVEAGDPFDNNPPGDN